MIIIFLQYRPQVRVNTGMALIHKELTRFLKVLTKTLLTVHLKRSSFLPWTNVSPMTKGLGPYSQNFIFLVTNEWAQ
jgi:hypothetical protein